MAKAYWIGIVDVKNHGRIKNLEGKKINRAVIIEFSSMDKAEKFYESEEYQKGLKYLNSDVSERFLNIAEGID